LELLALVVGAVIPVLLALGHKHWKRGPYEIEH
jgi:hypothetical protein